MYAPLVGGDRECYTLPSRCLNCTTELKVVGCKTKGCTTTHYKPHNCHPIICKLCSQYVKCDGCDNSKHRHRKCNVLGVLRLYGSIGFLLGSIGLGLLLVILVGLNVIATGWMTDYGFWLFGLIGAIAGIIYGFTIENKNIITVVKE